MDFVDARELAPGQRLDADLCIVGAGAAGLALALALAGSGRRVTLLESGGVDRDPELQELNAGACVGVPYADLRVAWLRQLGGTTNHWTAHTHPLDPIDFEARDWMPESGWPIARDELAPCYEQARRLLGLPDDPWSVERWELAPTHRAWRFAGESIRPAVVQIVAERQRRLAETLGPRCRAAPHVAPYLHATVCELVPDATLRRVERLRAFTAPGRSLEVRARDVVLATGGIETARLLLLSASVAPAGLGNAHDLVGRYFANHPEAEAGLLQVSRPEHATSFFAHRAHPDGEVYGVLQLAPALQRSERLPNLGFHLDRAIRRSPPRGEAFRFAEAIGRAASELDGAPGAPDPRALPTYYLKVVSEPAPNRESRVRLGDELDALGQRRVVLDWRLRDEDLLAIARGVRRLARELGASGIGRVASELGEASPPEAGTRSFHHLGTARMHPDPRRGVVDAECRVHGIENLWIASSAVFPTYGSCNPTLTILALALRLGERLRARPG